VNLPFEIGPIRPPSEARSLLLRVTRNCPWNRCAFCPVYKGAKFSIRSLDDVLADIQAMADVARTLQQMMEGHGRGAMRRAAAHGPHLPPGATQIALFLSAGGEHAFLQDANSLAMRPEQLEQVLRALSAAFPSLTRVTTYARAHTLTRRKPQQLAALRQAGLNRVHVGLESGSDTVLELVRKGTSAERQVQAGLRAKQAGMELSEYLMPGLGGRALWREHAVESARVLSAIDPHFIRLRSTAVAPGTGLEGLVAQGKMEPIGDEEVVAEIKLFLEHLEATSTLQSDHILNLLAELEGQLPEDKERLLEVIGRFQSLEPRLRRAFIIGRRAGQLTYLSDLDHPPLRDKALDLLARVDDHYNGDLDAAVKDLMLRFI